MRDYKKGKLLLETRPNQLLPIGTTKDGQASGSAQQQQKRILDKVWATVERVMAQMRNELQVQLQEPTRSVEEQEKTIEYAYLCPRAWSYPAQRVTCLGSYASSTRLTTQPGLTSTRNINISCSTCEKRMQLP